MPLFAVHGVAQCSMEDHNPGFVAVLNQLKLRTEEHHTVNICAAPLCGSGVGAIFSAPTPRV